LKLSIVIVARCSSDAAIHCVKSLRAGLKRQATEIILVNGLGAFAAVQLKEAGADVIVPVNAQWKISRQRAEGGRMATGEMTKSRSSMQMSRTRQSSTAS